MIPIHHCFANGSVHQQPVRQCVKSICQHLMSVRQRFLIMSVRQCLKYSLKRSEMYLQSLRGVGKVSMLTNLCRNCHFDTIYCDDLSFGQTF